MSIRNRPGDAICAVLKEEDCSRAGSWRASDDGPCMLALAVMQSGDAVMITDISGIVRFVNPSFEKISGYQRSEAIGKHSNLLNSGRHPPEFFADLWRTIHSGEVFRAVFINRRRCGDIYYDDKTITPIRDAVGNITHFVATSRDITERIETDLRLRYLENYDLLTELPNRRSFMTQLERTVARSRASGAGLALLYVDLDRFKFINDTLGHCVGDLLLKEVGERLLSEAPSRDALARLAGDEFALVLENMAAPEDAERLAARIVGSFSQPFFLNDQPLYLNVSVGVAAYPQDAGDAESLFKRADIAMFHAKLAGRATWACFSTAMEGDMLEDLALETSLHGALDRREFTIAYQPVVNPANQCIVAVEALLRWRSPAHGSVPPSRFIPILEASGMIVEVGYWALRTSVREMLAMWAAGADNVILAINLSGRQFRDVRLVENLRTIIRDTGIPPQQLEFEITESILIEDSLASAQTLDALKAIGVRLAIDDFGTGYSSLSYLRRFPIDTLKIDRSFVIEMETNADAVVIVRAIIGLAHALGLEVVGEGVETAGQLALLTEIGCRKVQGYWFSPPQTPTDLRRLIDESRSQAEGVPS